ncbi:Gfo/Idh/MocA family protein [Ruania halotolerans]|uniref:Gfo/Idh/MocA family protein n=1 Tax=Ruania halotolerans TaxID=2897773 RepID=UPI001E39334B|nr:Gfo/Idh/MocA family oxidoreductase [Ruania halotolerans]UFU06803.1 Gfo/Idh/MocA family oxidoreductase [Ruania halotolerans]
MSGVDVRIGIIGGGLMGRELAAALGRWPALIDHPVRPRLTAVCDIRPEALEWFRQIDTVTQLTTDYHEMLASDEIDVVYVAVRHDLHESIYTDVIAAGKDLLAEKPFGIDGPAAESILRACADHPEVFVRCSSEMPYFPGAQLAYRTITSGQLGRIVSVRSAFLHSSDLDVHKPINWKRQVTTCGAAGVMNDLGLHAWHVPLRLGWAPRTIYADLENIVTERPGPDGTLVPCDTWDNAVLHCRVDSADSSFPMTVETKRIEPGEKNTWLLEVVGMDGGVRFSTKNPKRVELFAKVAIDGGGSEQSWQQIDAGSQSAWPTVTGGIFEFGFSDAILQMWACFLAERAGDLGGRFATAGPQEAAMTHQLAAAALESHLEGRAVTLAGEPATSI